MGDLMAGRHAEHGTLDMSAWYMTAPAEDSGRRGVFVQQLFKDAVIGDHCRVQSHTFICSGVTLEDHVFVGHGVVFINDRHPFRQGGEPARFD